MAGWFYAPPPVRQPAVHTPIVSAVVQVQPAPRVFPWRVLDAWRDSTITIVERTPIAQERVGDDPPVRRAVPPAVQISAWMPKPTPAQRVASYVQGTANNIYGVSLIETATAADTVASVLTALGALSETGTASDAVNSGNLVSDSITETGTAADTTASALTAVGAIAETGTAADTLSSTFTAVAVIAETASASDVVASIAALIAQLTEAASAADSLSAPAGGGSVYGVSIIEAGASSDTVSSTRQTFPGITETGTAADSLSNALQALSQLTETGTASDALVSTWNGLASLAEVVAAIDSVFIQAGGLPPATRIITVKATSRTVRIDGSRSIRIH
jgi:hypothetical protein